ncbi:prepilin peptidase [Paenibacillus thermotolerans]|uniref:prepilin peptidase n=1 Tax=Paenibacillus thermotolerans TaxID=3027807 RepID=UPI002367D15F|nr:MULTISPECIES: A24 family peptidase [unclassified Paenibacillus]
MNLFELFISALAILGLLIGSFLNVAAIRSLAKASIVYPPSHCVHCKHRLSPWDLIPVLSYLLLGGKCRYCGQRISPVYPIGEASVALLFVWTGWHFNPLDLEWTAGLLLVSVLAVITHTDLKAMTIPDSVVFTGVALALALRVLWHPLSFWNYAAAAAIGFALLYLLAELSRGGMGGGDIKLYLFVGLLLGVKLTLLSLFLASIFGMVYGISASLLDPQKRRKPIPFGPFIAAGSFLSFLYGDTWVDSYLNLFAGSI